MELRIEILLNYGWSCILQTSIKKFEFKELQTELSKNLNSYNHDSRLFSHLVKEG